MLEWLLENLENLQEMAAAADWQNWLYGMPWTARQEPDEIAQLIQSPG